MVSLGSNGAVLSLQDPTLGLRLELSRQWTKTGALT